MLTINLIISSICFITVILGGFVFAGICYTLPNSSRWKLSKDPGEIAGIILFVVGIALITSLLTFLWFISLPLIISGVYLFLLGKKIGLVIQQYEITRKE